MKSWNNLRQMFIIWTFGSHLVQFLAQTGPLSSCLTTPLNGKSPFILTDFPLLQHVSVTSHPVSVHLWEQAGSIFTIPSHFGVDGSNDIFLYPSFLLAEQMLVPQPLLVCSPSFQIILSDNWQWCNSVIKDTGFALFIHPCQSFFTSKI